MKYLVILTLAFLQIAVFRAGAIFPNLILLAWLYFLITEKTENNDSYFLSIVTGLIWSFMSPLPIYHYPLILFCFTYIFKTIVSNYVRI
jgi:hypothetical protein